MKDKSLSKLESMADVRDILDIEVPTTSELTKESIIGSDKKNRKKYEYKVPKRPEGMHREVFALLCKDNNDVPPLFPTDTAKGYKQVRAKLGMKKVRPWKWTPFTNPARTDGAVFHHWRRVADAGKEYPFAKFNKKVPIPTYTNAEYVQHLVTNGWTRAETDHLFDLCRRFDLRFIIIKDRWDCTKFPARSVEDLKERYYQVCAALTKAKSHTDKVYIFDAEHEKRRKEQLKKLFERTPEQVEEEQMLLTELRKIEQRKKERDRKTQDLQKLITAADHQADPRKNERKPAKKTGASARNRPNKADTSHTVESAGIKFPDFKNSGVSLRSQRIKLPSSLGQKKMKGIEQMLNELRIELNPPPTEQICQQFNELRSDIVLHYELRSALSTCDYELQSLRHQYEALAPGKTLTIPPALLPKTEPEVKADIIDVVGSPSMPSITH
ncbi:DNA methyltransferase 1-associated protein 1 isoform X2 [Apis laboriosa]|uniref:DNA methyltransferase 1-associated protein 1 n=1 Tax=Apis mellifera TaxID=7460 RepID=A0A7M7R5D8_APIME|nr:DNA methyltransferase 1-associated protein 1 [Apis dorsata]XP_016904566.1 DNA methyltransferase 1-associated protein 1 [Apis cerana]XP_043799280.1 DNA methyltransferase 1-associated protein 1 isoform X2 [Apis laboriosa]XP_392117.2 DNA methyltransferase 1-associated protein 1 [Apis mellifera]|eukprot:XP_392117.2 DNA methyltransferase 1-associated protein 1 [Apis mellifera]